jgi:hypothetical protein
VGTNKLTCLKRSIIMKFMDHLHHNHFGWGILIAAFGVFSLIANLVPCHYGVMKFWPIFLIVAGLYKTFGGSCKNHQK